jgi:Ser/Thr protein kinase RdoA (MazF antagonist)
MLPVSTSSMPTILNCAAQFSPAVTHISPLGNGLINDSYLVYTKTTPFVLQRINSQVFPKPELIMENLKTLKNHLEKKISSQINLQIPDILPTLDGNLAFKDEKGDLWRALAYIANTESVESISSTNDAEQAGFALGHFHRLLSDLNPQTLHDTLPGFHITPEYLNRYQQITTKTSPGKASPENQFCADFISCFQYQATSLEAAKEKGLLSLRIIHGDPKLNNFLFDKQSRKIVSIIDLDTVKPGLVHYDIGDCLRSCCHNTETDTFEMDICSTLLASYLTEAGAFFSQADYHFLYSAIELIPFELGLRFFTDYLEGNRYFKVSEPGQNLFRACSQFRLCKSITAQKKSLEKLIKNLS